MSKIIISKVVGDGLTLQTMRRPACLVEAPDGHGHDTQIYYLPDGLHCVVIYGLDTEVGERHPRFGDKAAHDAALDVAVKSKDTVAFFDRDGVELAKPLSTKDRELFTTIFGEDLPVEKVSTKDVIDVVMKKGDPGFDKDRLDKTVVPVIEVPGG